MRSSEADGTPTPLDIPSPGVPARVRDGIWCLPLAFPDGTGRSTLSYLIEGSDGALTVIDPGWHAHDEFVAGLAALGRTTDDIALAVVTHLHVDHLADAVGLREHGARLALHAAERDALSTSNIDAEAATLARWGVPQELRPAIVADSASGRVTGNADVDVVLADGDVLPVAGRDIRVIHTPGHTAGSICLYDADANILYTGDHIMPRLQPGLGLGGPSASNPLDDYLTALDRVRLLDGVEVAPGHEYRFIGLAARVDAQREHQLARGRAVSDALDALDQPTLWQLAGALPWKRGFAAFEGHRLGSALAQTEFHVRRRGRSAEVASAV